ncbi:hypothetical protein G6N73_35810 [Mesorhizobium camelthorni]|uniref:Uncharacterized protein n=2 Tax=Allomesorhizobium camelthorni TaxID=475069 RepID=A0A6G4WPW6_9HYPH|nr:hypothetical protein [Mesorhizobium camelthorni]
MKTHDVAKSLNALARFLKNGPNEDLGAFLSGRSVKSVDDIPTALSTLVALSSLGKSQWLSLISQYNLPIDVRPRDASRDILGKILKHLEESPESRRRISQDAMTSRPNTSPELQNALRLLLRPKFD